MSPETARQLVHISMSAFALLLRVLTWWQAALCAAAALAFNVFVLPRVGGSRLARPADAVRGYSLGIVLYPVAVLALILAFPARLDIAGAAWGIMAFGDGAATLAGRALGRHRLPWNPDKTLEGLLGFVTAGGASGVFLSWWIAPSIAPAPAPAFTLLAPLAAAAAAGLAETLPIQLDDNITVPAVAGGALWLGSLVSGEAWLANGSAVAARLAPAAAVNTVAAAAGWIAGTVRASGTFAGWLIGVAVYAGLGPGGWLLLFATFFAAAATSRLGLARKTLRGIAEDRGGRRGAGNAFANTGLAALAALAAVTTPFRAEAAVAFVAALAAGGGDTVASEIGKAWGRTTYLPLTRSRVRPGTPGAVSIEGTAAGLVAALALAALGAWLGLVPWWTIWAVAAGAAAGSAVESLLAATLEASRTLNNDALNFLNTATAASVSVAITRLL